MSITIEPNQPVSFYSEQDPCDFCDTEEYCQLINVDDEVQFQFKQLPCGPNLICDPTLSESSENIVSNGTFDTGTVDWTLMVGWSYNGTNKTVAHAVGILNITPLKQVIDSLIAGKQYAVTFRISAYVTAVPLVISLGGGVTTLAPYVGLNTVIITPTTSGPGTELWFTPVASSAFEIDDIEVRELAPCWGVASGWMLEANALKHGSGTTAITTVDELLTVSDYYRVKFTITGRTQGSVAAKCGSAAGEAFTTNGDKEDYIICATNGYFSFVPSIDFDGSVSKFEIKLLRRDYNFQMLDLVTDTVIDDIPTNLGTYFRDYVTMKFIFSELRDPGCYKILLGDQCYEYLDDMVENGYFENGVTGWTGYNFTYESGRFWCRETVGGLLRQFYDGGASEYTYYGNTVQNYKYRIKVEGFVSATAYVSLLIGGQELVHITAPGIYEGEVTTAGVPVTNTIRINVGNDVAGSDDHLIYIDEISIVPIVETVSDFISNCFNYKQYHDCTKQLVSFCDEEAFNFEFINSGFKMIQRIGMSVSNPYFPDDEENYGFSNGERKIIYAGSEKYFACKTEHLPDYVHSALRLQTRCDHFLIDGTEYYCKKGTHEPLWKDGCNSLAPSRFDIRNKIDKLYNRN